MLKRTDHRPLLAHVWTKDPHGFYIEPEWCARRLFEVERFNGVIKDPACGVGRIADAARAPGYNVIATDLIDRGYPQFVASRTFSAANAASITSFAIHLITSAAPSPSTR